MLKKHYRGGLSKIAIAAIWLSVYAFPSSTSLARAERANEGSIDVIDREDRFFNFHRLTNIDNSPLLEEAMQHDFELNGHDEVASDRNIAIRRYLEYLETTDDPVQRVGVLVQLGALHSTNIFPHRGERPDWERATLFFDMAIETAPESFNRSLLRARINRISPVMPIDGRIRARIDVLEWISTLDEEALREMWLRPAWSGLPSTEYVDSLLREGLGLIYNVEESQAYNVVEDAIASKDPHANLSLIINELPDSKAASIVKKYQTESSLQRRIAIERHQAETVRRLSASNADEGRTSHSKSPVASASSPQAAGRGNVGPLPETRQRWVWVTAALALLVSLTLVVGGVYFYLCRVRRRLG